MNDYTDPCEDDVFFLTEAGEAALALRDQLRSVDGQLGLPPSRTGCDKPEEPLA